MPQVTQLIEVWPHLQKKWRVCAFSYLATLPPHLSSFLLFFLLSFLSSLLSLPSLPFSLFYFLSQPFSRANNVFPRFGTPQCEWGDRFMVAFPFTFQKPTHPEVFPRCQCVIMQQLGTALPHFPTPGTLIPPAHNKLLVKRNTTHKPF